MMKNYFLVRDVLLLDQPQGFFKIISDFAMDFKTTKQKYIEHQNNMKKQKIRMERIQAQQALQNNLNNPHQAIYTEQQNISGKFPAAATTMQALARFKKLSSSERLKNKNDSKNALELQKAVMGNEKSSKSSRRGSVRPANKKQKGLISKMKDYAAMGLSSISGSGPSNIEPERELPSHSNSSAANQLPSYKNNNNVYRSTARAVTNQNNSINSLNLPDLPPLETLNHTNNNEIRTRDPANSKRRSRPKDKQMTSSIPIPEGMSLDDPNSISAVLTSEVNANQHREKRERRTRRGYIEDPLAHLHDVNDIDLEKLKLKNGTNSQLTLDKYEAASIENNKNKAERSQNLLNKLDNFTNSTSKSTNQTAVLSRTFNQKSTSTVAMKNHDDLLIDPELPPLSAPQVINNNGRRRRRRNPV